MTTWCNRLTRRNALHAIASASAVSLVPSLAAAQDGYPSKPIRYIVPFPPGGLTDVMARLIAQSTGMAIKQSVLVDNRAGASANLGADLAAKSSPDGYTWLAITLAHAVNQSLFSNLPYSLEKNLAPVAHLATSPLVLVVNENNSARSVADLLAQARAKRLNCGSSGNGTPPHLTMALFNDLNKTQMTHVPYRGGAPSMTDLIGGQLDVIFSNFPESIAHVKGGKLRALAICSLSRHPTVPDVPTAMEAGMPGLFVENWTAAMIQAKTPDAIVDRYSREMIKIMFSADMEERARQQGFRVTQKGASDFAVFLKNEVDRWSRIIKTAKITAT